MELDYKGIGKRVRAARDKKGITQEQLSELANLSISHVSNIETGTTNMSLSAIISLANSLDVTTDDLLCDNLIHARIPIEAEMKQILDSCSSYELRLLADVSRSVLDSFRRNEKLFRSEME